MIVTAVVYCWVLLAAFSHVHDALALPYAGGNHNQWSGGRGAMGGYQQQQQQQQQRGWNQGGGYNNNGGGGFGGYNNQGQGGGWGGRPQWQSGGNGQQQQGAEAYRTNVFNEPDRYGYDYTIPGATVHYLMYKKQGNRGPSGGGNYGGNNGNYGVDSSGWNRNRNHY